MVPFSLFGDGSILVTRLLVSGHPQFETVEHMLNSERPSPGEFRALTFATLPISCHSSTDSQMHIIEFHINIWDSKSWKPMLYH